MVFVLHRWKMHIIQLALLSLWLFILLYLHTFSAYSFYICLIHYIQVKSLSDMENTFVCRFDSCWGQMHIIQLALLSLWLFILLYLHTFSAYSFYICLIHCDVQVKSLSDMENTFVCRFDSYWGQMYIIQLVLLSLWLFILLYLHKLINY
jgi:hypothetical protein